ncbi:bacteriophage abortive infection AbiH family protein [Moritella marina]|uniref:bacteriophage abortive infection AbiH family protein n=1 Tax=Moritella marina TaxID=90736 RepID=UPI001F0B23EC|nr:bacteriophage abortive infection AbiH family protein [Moritella marina]
MKIPKLYIIGNGFDLWHGLPTSYDDFYVFAKELLDEMESYYLFDMSHSGPWSDFENSLGFFEWKYFYEAYNHIDVTSESFRPSEAYGLEDELTEQADSHVEAIKESFREWIEEIDASAASQKLKLPREANYLTFNYTSTLQSVYGIHGDKVLHIHGQAESYDELIFGHGETREEEPELDENGDSNRTMFSDAEGAAKYPFYAFQKPVNEVLQNNFAFVDSLNNYLEITVIGHSFNKIDLPYFKRLAERSKNAIWLVSTYEESDAIHHLEQLVKCGVPAGKIRTCTYEELQSEHST